MAVGTNGDNKTSQEPSQSGGASSERRDPHKRSTATGPSSSPSRLRRPSASGAAQSRLRNREQQAGSGRFSGSQRSRGDHGGSGLWNDRGDKLNRAEKEAGRNKPDTEKDKDDGKWNDDGSDDNNKRRFGRFRITPRKLALGGLLGGMTVTGVAGYFSIFGGPAQIVQLSEILENPLSSQDSDSSYSMGRLLRWGKNGQYGETRVGKLGSTMVKNSLTTLESYGIKFNLGSLSQVRSGVIDTAETQKKVPALRGMSQPERQAYLENLMKLPEGTLQIVNGSRTGSEKYYFNGKKYSVASLRLTIRSSLSLLGDDRLRSFLNFRAITKYTGLPSILSPVNRAVQGKVNQTANKLEMRKLEKERLKRLQPKETTKFQAARDKIKSVMDGKTQTVSRALLFTSGMCLIRAIAQDVPEYNRGAVVLPAIAKTTDKIAFGNAVKSNQTNMPATAAVADSFINAEGQTIWGSKPLDALSRPNSAEGQDLPADYKQAYSVDTTAANIEGTLGGGGVGGVLCSPAGLVVQMTGSFLLFLAGPASDGASWGVIAARFGVQAAATYGMISFIQHQATKQFATDAVLPEVFDGPLGGSLYAYSSRALEGTIGRSTAGVALSPADEAAVNKERELASQQEFRRKSLFRQIYDKNDYRSLSSQMAMSISPNIGRNLSGIAASVTSPSKLFSGFSSIFTAKVGAASKPYDWGFPIYGLPSQIKNDPRFDNPYDNADKVAALLDSDAGDDYIDRASKCFGVDVSKGSDGWQAVAKEDVNPSSSDYIGADCANLSDLNWERMIVFVSDSRTADSWDCFIGGLDTSDQSCQNIGYTGANTLSDDIPDTTPTTDAGSTIDMDNLYKSSVDIKCAEGTKDLGTQDGYANGQKVKIRICALPNLTSTSEESNGGYGVSGADGKGIVNSRVSGVVYNMVEAAKKDGVTLSLNSSFRTMAHQQALCAENARCSAGKYDRVAKPGTSNHQMGLALDIATLPSDSGPVPGNPVWAWLVGNADKFGYKNYPAEAWHWSPTGS